MANPIVTSLPKYVEQHILPLISKSVLGSKSASLFNLLTGVKGDTALNLLATDVTLQSAKTCGWNADGTTTLSQRIVKPAYLKVNHNFCDKQLLNTWANYEVKIAAGQKTLPFEEDFVNGIVEQVKEQIEKMIYQGTKAKEDEFEGLISILTDDATTIKVNKTKGTSAYEAIKAVYASEREAGYPKEGNQGEYSIFEALKLDGTRLWWVNCGPNMGDFQNNEQNIVAYDWDGDGKAEVVMRAADGTTIHCADGSTYVVGDASKNYRSGTKSGQWFMCTGAEYLVYMDGVTGKPYECKEYPLKRLEDGETDLEKAWGDGYGHRCTKHFFGAPYLDGKKPSIFLARGIYTRHKMIALDVDPATHTLKERWRWFNNTNGPWKGQGYHNYAIADVDLDGRDEIVFGSMVIDDNGKGLSTTGFGHGDAQHVGDLNPYAHGLEQFACNEDEQGFNYRDATTSKVYVSQLKVGSDIGRCMCGNFTDLYPTMENQSQNFTVKNNGEVDASISFEITGLTILGVEYQIVDTKPDDNSTTYIIKNAEKESTTDTSKMCGDIINDTERFPFVLSVERDKKIEKNGGTGTITATFKWDGTDDTKHELDSIWGYNMANYYENNTDKAGIQLKLKLKTEQIEE